MLPGCETNALPTMDGRHGIRRWALNVSVETRKIANADICAAMDAQDPIAYVAAIDLNNRAIRIGNRFCSR